MRPSLLLQQLEVLLVDCQATGPNPDSGSLLEIGWSRFRAEDSTTNCCTRLLKLPEAAELTPRTSAITGISTEELEAAGDQEEAWNELAGCARDLCRANRVESCPTIIHFARYEKPFLEHLHRHSTGESSFPLEIFCTHEMITRLNPGLPRKGLRAVAGYFGLTVPQQRRCEHHLLATARIWREIVVLLDHREGIRTLDELRRWLGTSEAPPKTVRTYPLDRDLRTSLPDRPGVYRMLRSNGDLLYIGKARSLKQRVNSYFQASRRHPEHILEMLTQAQDLDVTPTGSALEAAILETDEIKLHTPPYNVALKEGTRSICFSSTDFSQLAPEPGPRLRSGPFPSERAAVSLRAIGRLLDERDPGGDNPTEETIARALGMPTELVPDSDVFSAGFALFCQEHPVLSTPGPLPFELMRIGRELWASMLARREAEPATEDEEFVEEQDAVDITEWAWSPESVLRALESSVRRAAHAVRRGRWFCLLSQASLSWGQSGDEEGTMNVVVFHDGAVRQRKVIGPAERIPTPPGYRKGHARRLGVFDLATYDRMRVVTTEMRRLMGEGRRMRLRLSPAVVLDDGQLATILHRV